MGPFGGKTSIVSPTPYFPPCGDTSAGSSLPRIYGTRVGRSLLPLSRIIDPLLAYDPLQIHSSQAIKLCHGANLSSQYGYSTSTGPWARQGLFRGLAKISPAKTSPTFVHRPISFSATPRVRWHQAFLITSGHSSNTLRKGSIAYMIGR